MSKLISRHSHGDVLELELARAPVNALDPQLVAELLEAVRTAPAQGARGLVLSGRPGMFSAGLDVPALLQLQRPQMQAFWRDYVNLCAALARSPVPVVAALTGHSPAGGAVLAIMCDYRVMAEGDFIIGLNEVQIGLVVPEFIQHALRRLVGTYRAERLVMSGAMPTTAQALQVGLVDEAVAAEEVVPRSVAWAQELLALPADAVAQTRQLARADLTTLFDEDIGAHVAPFLDIWFSNEAQSALHGLVARLQQKKKD